MSPDLRLSFSASMWVQAAYLLATAVLLIPLGRLADQHGRVRFYLIGVVVFTAGLAAGRGEHERRLADRQPHRAGRRRGAAERDLGRHRHGRVPALGARPGARHQRHGRVHRAQRRAAARRLPRRHSRLALDLPRQPADRRRRVRLGLPAAAAGRARGEGAAARPTWPARPCSASSSSACWCRSPSPRSGAGRRPRRSACSPLAAASPWSPSSSSSCASPTPCSTSTCSLHNRLFAAANTAALLNYMALYAISMLTAVFLEVVQDRSAGADRLAHAQRSRSCRRC